MTIRYKNLFRDLLAFCLYHYPRSPVVLVSYAVTLVPVLMIAFSAVAKDTTASLAARIITVVVLVLCALLFMTVISAASIVLGVISRRNKTFLTEHTISLADNGFTSETPDARTDYKWSIVQKLGRNRNYIFIYIGQHSAHVVPLRAFRDRAEADSFFEFCKTRTKRT